MSCTNNLKLGITVLVVFLMIGQLKAQNYIPFSLYFKNWKIVNPAMAGLESGHRFDIMHRAQGMDYEGHPSYSLISYEAKINNLNSGLGFVFNSQQIGVHNENYLKANLNNQIKLSEAHKISIGVSANYIRRTANYRSLEVISIDPIIMSGVEENSFDLDFGAAYRYKNLNIGLGVRNLLQTQENPRVIVGAEEDEKYPRSLYIHGQYKYSISIFEFCPSVLYFRRENQSDFVDFNGVLNLFNIFQFGGTIRLIDSHDSYNIYAGLQWKDRMEIMALFNSEYLVYQPTFDWGKNFEIQLSISID